MTTKRLTPMLAFGLLALACQQDARGVELDLDRTVALAIAQNPGLQSAADRREEVASQIRQARADAFPQLTLVASWDRSRNPSLLNSKDFEEILGQFPGGVFRPSEQTLHTTQVQISQALFTWGKIGAAVELAELATKAVSAQIDTAVLDTTLAAVRAYFDLRSSRAALAVIELQEEARRAALAVVQARFNAGDATRLELLRSEAALAEVAPAVARTRGSVAVAESGLRAVLGLEPGVPIVTVEAPESLPRSLPSPETLVAAALSSRPELTDLRFQEEARHRQRRVIQADGRPSAELTGSWGRQARVLENLDDPLFADWRVGIGVRWEVSDGGRRRAQVAQVNSQLRQLQWQQREMRSAVAFQVEQAWHAAHAATASWRAAEFAARAAREASRIARENYEQGVALQADLLDAQQREIEASVLAVTSFYEALTRQAELNRAMGLLPTDRWPAEDPEGVHS